MNKNIASFLCIPLILVACSSDSSTNATTNNQNLVFLVMCLK
jgi:hypothetical protein